MFGLFHRPKLGLVLGGGGARGGAHIGAMKVLNEVGYQPDMIVGCSIGALMAAMVGIGWSTEQMDEALCQFGTTVVDCSVPSGLGVTRSERLHGALLGAFGDADLRDLKPHVAILATDIRRRQRVIIRQGSVVQAVFASMAIPGVFDPVSWGDCLLVDGGVLDNLPTQAAYELGAERLVAVDVKGCEWSVEGALDDLRSINRNMHRAIQWVLNISRRHETFEMCMTSMQLPSAALAEYYLSLYPPDVLIEPKMPRISLLAMDQVPATIRAGEQAACEVKPQIKALLKRRSGTLAQRAKALPSLLVL